MVFYPTHVSEFVGYFQAFLVFFQLPIDQRSRVALSVISGYIDLKFSFQKTQTCHLLNWIPIQRMTGKPPMFPSTWSGASPRFGAKTGGESSGTTTDANSHRGET